MAVTTAMVWAVGHYDLEVADHNRDRRLEEVCHCSSCVGLTCESTWWMVESFTELEKEQTWRGVMKGQASVIPLHMCSF